MATLVNIIKQMFPNETDESIQSDLQEVRAQHPEWTDVDILKNLQTYASNSNVTGQPVVAMPTDQDAERYRKVREYVAQTRGPDRSREFLPMLAKGIAGAADAGLAGVGEKSQFMPTLMAYDELKKKQLEDSAEKEMTRISGRERIGQLYSKTALAGKAKAEAEDPNSPAANAARETLAKLDPEGHAAGRYDKMGKSDLNKQISNLTGIGKLDTTKKGQEMTDAQRREERIVKMREDVKQSQAYKNWLEIKNSAQNLKDAAANPTSKRSLGAIYSYVRALDPGSVVREGEIKLSQEARSKFTQAEGLFRKITMGQVLTPSEIQELADWAKGKETYARKTAINSNKSTVNQAQRLGYELSEISTDLFAPGWDQPEKTEEAAGGAMDEIRKQLPPGAKITGVRRVR